MVTEDRFKEMLRTELDARPAPAMSDVVRRAAEGGRRRARRRTIGQVVGATLSVMVVAAGIVGAASLRSAKSDAVPPATVMLPPSPGGAEWTAGDRDRLLPSKPVANNPLADQLPPILEELLPPGAKQTFPYTGEDGGIYVAADWETGQGLVQIIFSVADERFFGCTMGLDGHPTVKPTFSPQCSVTPDGVLVGRYLGNNPDTGIAWRHVQYVTGRNMVTLSYANGPLRNVAQPTRPTLPFTDEAAFALLTNSRWQPVADKYTAPPAAP